MCDICAARVTNVVERVRRSQIESFSCYQTMKDPWIYEQPGSLEVDICKRMIDKFEADDRCLPGKVHLGFKPDQKLTLDLGISSYPDWREFDALVYKSLAEGLKQYRQHLIAYDMPHEFPLNLRDKGYQMQKYEQGKGFFGWHDDFMVYPGTNEHREYTFIWYLNDISNGGETEFKDRIIRPETGKLLLFPASWTYRHKGHVPKSGHKYICTGWLSCI